MQFGDTESGWGWMLAGMIVLATGLMLRRRSGPRVREPLTDLQSDIRRRESSMIGQLQRMEVRLHDATREVEGRLQTRVAQLDQLIVEADREIARLQKLLNSDSTARDSAQRRQAFESSLLDDVDSPEKSAVDLIVRLPSRTFELDSAPPVDHRRTDTDEAAA